MNFTFFCTIQNKPFECSDYTVIKNRGVKKDAAGNRMLDAKVALNTACPYCGQKHVYHANELSCPFGDLVKWGGSTEE